MLSSDLVRPRVKRRGGIVTVDMLDVSERHWLRTAQEMIRLFGAQIGKSYSDWQAALDQYEGERMDYIVVRGLAKVMEDAATFEPIPYPVLPADARERLFAMGPAFGAPDLFNPHTRNDAVKAVAREFRTSMKAVEGALYADRLTEHTLREVGQLWTPETLLARYNLELARGVLYDASEMRVELHDHYKDFWRYMKLFKLMFEAAPLAEGGYSVRLDGPISPFVNATRRYGRQFAAFLPALFLCERWKMAAEIVASRNDAPAVYVLDDSAPLQTHFKGSGPFDSLLEKTFADEFEEKFGGERGAWTLTREDEVVIVSDTVFIPDFTMTNKADGRRALVELVGFWHPDYLRRKVAKVRGAQLKNLVLLVRESVNLAPERLADVPGEVIYFPNKPVMKDVIRAVEACAQ